MKVDNKTMIDWVHGQQHICLTLDRICCTKPQQICSRVKQNCCCPRTQSITVHCHMVFLSVYGFFWWLVSWAAWRFSLASCWLFIVVTASLLQPPIQVLSLSLTNRCTRLQVYVWVCLIACMICCKCFADYMFKL